MNVADIMTREVITIEPEAILATARLMLQHKISGLPVVDASRNLKAASGHVQSVERLRDCRR
jgi:CBS-domain-containing membrane protein